MISLISKDSEPKRIGCLPNQCNNCNATGKINYLEIRQEKGTGGTIICLCDDCLKILRKQIDEKLRYTVVEGKGKKITLEIDLMDIFSDVENDDYGADVESVGETLKRELKDRVLNEISNKIIKNYSERLEEEIKPFYLETLEKLKKDIASFYETYMDKKVIITDSYGYITKENISIRELIQEKIEDSISLKPKSQLRESINNTCKYEIDKAVNKVVYELQKEMNEQITLEMAKKIKEKLLS